MVTVTTKKSGPMNRNSILSINIPEPQSVKNKNTITTIVKNSRNSSPASRYARQPNRQAQPAITQQPSRQTPSRSPQQQNIQPALTAGQQNTGGTPIARPVPTLQNQVQKGQKTLLSTAALTAVDACFGWNVTDARCDVDVSAFMLGTDGKVIGDSWFVFYGQTLSPDQSTKFVTGGGIDRELIHIDFGRLNPQVKKIVFVLTINDALVNGLHFGMLKDAYVRILDPSGKELVSFLMRDYYKNIISMMIGELYQHNGAWKFNAVGNGIAKDLAGLCALYGVQVL
ncbi:MAG: TerD family protein [Lachnospiraceae bacterium]|nr:TerD family protein [Lachnospiraceae bacterium]